MYNQQQFYVTKIESPYSKPIYKNHTQQTEHWVVKKKPFDIHITSHTFLLNASRLDLTLLYDKPIPTELSLTTNQGITYQMDIINEKSAVIHCSIDVLTSQMENHNFLLQFNWIDVMTEQIVANGIIGSFHTVSKEAVIKSKNDLGVSTVSGKKRNRSGASNEKVLKEIQGLKELQKKCLDMLHQQVSNTGEVKKVSDVSITSPITSTVISSGSGITLEPCGCASETPEEMIMSALSKLTKAYEMLGEDRSTKFRKVLTDGVVDRKETLLEISHEIFEYDAEQQKVKSALCWNQSCPYQMEMGNWAMTAINSGEYEMDQNVVQHGHMLGDLNGGLEINFNSPYLGELLL